MDKLKNKQAITKFNIQELFSPVKSFIMRIIIFNHWVLAGLLAIYLSACSGNRTEPSYTAARVDSLHKAFAQYIEEKNKQFKTADWSPLKQEDKGHFKGLNYYPYDESFRFRGAIKRYDRPDSITVLGTREGDLRPALRFGYFEFQIDDKTQRLEIIKILPRHPGGSAHLFLGFWDATSGVDTYAGGRYVDIGENDQDSYVIDFNYAYNPYCAYNERYSCAIPPLENRLEIALTCGEKNFKDH